MEAALCMGRAGQIKEKLYTAKEKSTARGLGQLSLVSPELCDGLLLRDFGGFRVRSGCDTRR